MFLFTTLDSCLPDHGAITRSGFFENRAGYYSRDTGEDKRGGERTTPDHLLQQLYFIRLSLSPAPIHYYEVFLLIPNPGKKSNGEIIEQTSTTTILGQPTDLHCHITEMGKRNYLVTVVYFNYFRDKDLFAAHPSFGSFYTGGICECVMCMKSYYCCCG